MTGKDSNEMKREVPILNFPENFTRPGERFVLFCKTEAQQILISPASIENGDRDGSHAMALGYVHSHFVFWQIGEALI
jgi:hypothetical protein